MRGGRADLPDGMVHLLCRKLCPCPDARVSMSDVVCDEWLLHGGDGRRKYCLGLGLRGLVVTVKLSWLLLLEGSEHVAD